MSGHNRTKPCVAFAKGQCHRGDKCPFRHGKESPNPCPYFNTPKGCYKGKSCPLPHVKSNQPTPIKSTRTEDYGIESDCHRWHYQVPKPGAKHVGVDTAEIFGQAWQIIEKNHAPTRQQIIKTLASEEGLMLMKVLTDQMMTEQGSSSMLNLFITKVLPFFRIISHFEVLSSLTLELQLETIFNFLFGPNGRRAVPVFRFTANALNEMIKRDMGVQTEYPIALTAVAIVLQRIVELNQTAQLIGDFQDILEVICNSIPQNLPLEAANREIRRTKERLGIGMAIGESSGKRSDVQPVVFELEQDLPGSLSAFGRRHDNDNEDIRKIKILPTAGEILSDRPEYLPSARSTKGHLSGVNSLLDRQFRLLREDTIGHARDTIRMEQEMMGQPHHDPNDKMNHFTYHNARLLTLGFCSRIGMSVTVEFDQPQPVRNRGPKLQRQTWWEESKRLRADSFVALVSKETVVFFSVSHNERDCKSEYPGLHDDPRRATVSLGMVDPTDDDITWICKNLGADHQQSLIELPSVLLASFKPTLQALQKMAQSSLVPFTEFLAPASTEPVESGVVYVPPPAYAQSSGFTFKLACLKGTETLCYTPGNPTFDYNTFHSNSTLDESQQTALINALSHRVALIQGPPGTGKSYTGVAAIKTVLQSKSTGFGPIICVCYTNHALDQLLEQLLDQEVHNIIRMGSRSKSERLRKLNLHERRKNASLDWRERKNRALLFQSLEREEAGIANILRDINNSSGWKSIRDHLRKRHPKHFSELFPDDVDASGFQPVRNFNKVIKHWLRGGRENTVNRPVSGLASISAWEMSRVERKAIYAHWAEERKAELTHCLLSCLTHYNTTKSGLDKCYQEESIDHLREADVIGVTTTGLAKNIDNLWRVGAKVVVCEEAGEVLEAHLLTVLLPTVEHLILIGDHQQLRPQINTYELRQDHPTGKRLSFDISLFERLVCPDSQTSSPKLPYSTLEVQRRMHPSIAELVRCTLYPTLNDHSLVAGYPEVDGMRRRLFWLDHQRYEDSTVPSNSSSAAFSKTNSFEVELVATLVSYLLRQGTFQSEDIAVLTPYLGQLHLIRRRLSSSFEIILGDQDVEEMIRNGLDSDSASQPKKVQRTALLGAVRAATVDNFQGEEAKVVIISLVRSNPGRKCGFLKTSNRINVLLSRARHGMYIIGNRDTAESAPMWKEVTAILEQNGNIGTSLELRCARHKDTPIKVKTPDDFAVFAPEGGCNKKCAWRLQCGHACINKCHSEMLHNAVKCLERCQRMRNGCDHPCPKSCGDPCPKKCVVPVADITLSCGHLHDSLPCYQAQTLDPKYCKTAVEVLLPHCGHKKEVSCSELQTDKDHKCYAVCGATLPCGHACKRQCHECIQNGETTRHHGECTAICDRRYVTCGHTCQSPCHGDEPCPLCENACEVKCAHSRCKKKCHEPCTPCAEECSWSCPHYGKCELPCAVPCDRLPCSKRCEEMLECGHQCPSVCGEQCPDKKYCQECGDGSIRKQIVDYILGKRYDEVDLNEDPCLVPSCGHVLTMENMDGHLEFSSYYELSDKPGFENVAVRLKYGRAAFTMNEVKTCPMCRGSLRNINRYGRIVRRALIGEATKRFIVWANAKIVPLAQTLDLREAELTEVKAIRGKAGQQQAVKSEAINNQGLYGGAANQLKVVWQAVRSDNTFRNIFTLRGNIKGFLYEVGEKEQPLKRVHDLRQDYYKRRGITVGRSEIQDGSEVLQVRNRLLATALLLRCEYAILAKFLELKGGSIPVDLTENRATCNELVIECEWRKQPRGQIEGLLYWGSFAALEIAASHDIENQDTGSAYRTQAHEYLEKARTICADHPAQTSGLMTEIAQVEKTLRESRFYLPVTNEERAAVYVAMQRDFMGTGHWYYCENGHPFTVGECGMPMESSRCPECGSPVGGQRHEVVDGVTRANDMDDAFARLAI